MQAKRDKLPRGDAWIRGSALGAALGRRLTVAFVAALCVVAVVGFTVLSSPLLSALFLAVAVAVLAPKPVFGLSLLWIFLVRPGYEVVHLTLGGFTVTEIDFLPLLALIAAIAMAPDAGIDHSPARSGTILLIIAMPLWFALRFAVLPSTAVLHVSPYVDLRSITMFSAVVPMWLYLNKQGFRALFRLLMVGAYAACFIAIAAWLLLVTHVVAPANTTFVYFHAFNDVRPGGELLVLVLAVSLLTQNEPLFLRNRWLSLCVVGAEFAVSQTLSMVVAVVVAFVFFNVLYRGKRSAARVIVALLLLGVFVGAAVGGVASGSRFDLGERLGESSAQYRATELANLTSAVTSSPQNLIVGLGPGSALAVKNVYTGLIEIKRDTHNTYGNVTMKGGLIALALFLLPIAVGIRRLLGTRRERDLCLAAALVGISVLTVTVPFAWTAAGSSALVAILLGALQSSPAVGAIKTAQDRSAPAHS